MHEGRDPGAARPVGPLVERRLAFFAFDGERVTQPFFEEVGAPEPRAGLGDPVELVALPAGEITGVLPQRIAGLGDSLRVAGRAALAGETNGRAPTFRVVPRAASFDVERLDRPRDDV